MRLKSAMVLLCLLWPFPLSGQGEPRRPIVRVVGTATEEIQPDYALIGIGVRIQAETPEAAVSRMSERIATVVDALAALGFSRDSLPTRVFSVGADRNYSEGNRITGYTATLQLNLRTSELGRIAEFVGAALSAGATEIGSITFASTEAEAAYETALRRALQAAEREAKIIAEAQGGALGSLIEVSTVGDPAASSAYLQLEGGQARSRGAISLAMTPQVLSIGARVIASWQLR